MAEGDKLQKSYIELLKSRGEAAEKVSEQERKGLENYTQTYRSQLEELTKLNAEKVKNGTALTAEEIKNLNELQSKLMIAENNYEIFINNTNKKTLDDLNKNNADKTKSHDDFLKGKKALDDAAFNTYIEDLKARFQAEQDEMKRQQAVIDAVDAEEKAEQDKIDAENNANPNFVGGTAWKIKQGILVDENIEREKALSTAKLAVQDAYINAVHAGFGILQGFANKNKQLQNVLFGIEKAVAAANVFVNMKREIAGIYTKYSLVPGSAFFGPSAIEATAARIRGVTSIAQILATTIGKFASGGGGGSVGGGGGGGGGFAATGGASQGVPINPVSQASTLLNPDGTVKTDPNAADQRVYVLETDITRTQNKVSGIENKAKIE